jgi:hypothetical protein
LDELTQFTIKRTLTGSKYTNYCGWQKIHDKEDFITKQNDDYIYKDLCNDNDNDNNNNEFCDMKKGGIIWLSLSILSLIMGLIAMIGICQTIYKKSKGLIIIGSLLFSLCCVASILVWYTMEHCKEWCDEYSDIISSCHSKWGLSTILMIGASGLGLLTSIFASAI